MEQTSVSDNNQYPVYCYMASKNDEEFNNFKHHPVYNLILEHLTPEQGKAYLEVILRNDGFQLSPQDWKYFLQNDTVGSPRTAQYAFGDMQITCSPTTLRYIKVLCDIAKLFPESILRGGGI